MSNWQAPATAQAAIRGLCPRCGASGLFRGTVSFGERCETCGLDYRQFNVGDGPAAFLILLISPILIIGALSLEFGAHPPFWVHIIVWVPVATGMILGALRVAKGALLALEYKNRAREGRLAE